MGSAADGADLLGAALDRAVRAADASLGTLHLLAADGETLPLTAVSGLPVQVTAPWARLFLRDPLPLTEAVREQRLVWIASHAELARRFPRSALLIPYESALVAAPVTGPAARGVLALHWPGSHSPQLSAKRRSAVDTACADLGSVLGSAPDGPPGPPQAPRPVPRTRPARQPGGADAEAELVDRLPGSYCAVDTAGRITFAGAAAAGLAGRDVRDLPGLSLWEAFPWLDDPVFAERYRAAVLSRQTACATVERAEHQRVACHLYPDASGVSLRLAPAGPADTADRPDTEDLDGLGAPSRAVSLYDLMQLAASLAEAVSVQDVVELGADRIVSAFGAQGVVVSVADGGKLHVVGHRGYRPEVIERLDHAPFRDPDAPTVRALTTGTPLFYASRREMTEVDPAIPGVTGREAWAFLPLTVSGHAVGACVVSWDRPHPFSNDERSVLTSVAALIAQALDRARLYDAKHQLAQKLQTALLPSSLPRVPGLDVAARYLPASHGMDIGGDFYDVIRCDETGVAATIGDVQGHSINAAALMGQVRTSVHATAGVPPSDVLSRTNRLLTDLDTGLFTSCVYASLDLVHHRVDLANAGHLPPILRRPDGHTEVLDPEPGLLLGIDRDTEYRTTALHLPPGAMLALYTDGLVEVPGTDIGDAIAALADLLSRTPQQSLDGVADALIRPHEHTDHRPDDIALLLLRMSPDGG